MLARNGIDLTPRIAGTLVLRALATVFNYTLMIPLVLVYLLGLGAQQVALWLEVRLPRDLTDG